MALPQSSERFFILQKAKKNKQKKQKKKKKPQKITNNDKEFNHKIVTVISVCPSCESY